MKTSRDDLLSLLVDAGADCIGDISVVRDAESPREVTPAVDTAALSTIRFADILEESLAGKHGLEPTLPGVQEKVSAARNSLPLRATGGSGAYILKLNPPKMPRLVENEHFFLQMARSSGLEVARAELVHDRDGAAGLLVDRFDRVTSKGGGVAKVHQEDACQFLDRYPGDKYVLSYADIARGISELGSAPLVEIAKYLRLVAFSYLAANGDLHAKNVSLRTVPDDGRDDNLKRAGFVAFGERHGVRRAATEASLDELCDVAPAWIDRLEEIGLEPRKTADLRRVMKKRRGDLAAKGKTG